MAPGERSPIIVQRELRVFSPSGWANATLPSGSVSWPTAWGICLSTIRIPMPASIPLMTEAGKK